MRHISRPISPSRPASFSMALLELNAQRWVALLLAFFLATHVFWCGVGASRCLEGLQESSSQNYISVSSISNSSLAGATKFAQHVLAHDHTDLEDVCSGSDETRNRAEAAKSAFVPPLFLWVAIVFCAVALVLVSLVQRAAVFGRDGPVSVPALHSRLVRTSLPHRAPPVFLT